MGNINISILGKEYTIKSDVEEKSLNQIANHLNQKVEEIIKTTKTVATHNILILAAMSIANDYFQAKDLNEALVNRVESKCDYLVSRINSQM